jgi:hypothetical protein
VIKEQPSAGVGLDWAAPQVRNVDSAQQLDRVLGDAIGNQQTRRWANETVGEVVGGLALVATAQAAGLSATFIAAARAHRLRQRPGSDIRSEGHPGPSWGVGAVL